MKMAEKRGRPAIKPQIKKLIYEKARETKEVPRLALAIQLTELIEKMGEIPPSEEYTIKLISEARNRPKVQFDELWSLGSLVQNPIPADAMPVVMSIYKKALARNKELTIRQVQWIARLYKTIDDTDLLWDWAWAYAIDEWLSEITNKPFDTTELDLELLRNPQYAQESRRDTERLIAIWGIAERLHPDFRGPGANFDTLFSAVAADFNALMELNLSIEETEEIAKSGKYNKEAQNERKRRKKRQK